MGRWGRRVVGLGLLLCLGAPGAWGESDHEVSASPDQVEQFMTQHNLYPAFDKLGRGVANLFGGWLEIPLNIHKRYSAHDTGASFFTGAAHGIFRGAVRTGVGLYETVTFLIPYPEQFAPILPTIEYFQRSKKREPLPLE